MSSYYTELDEDRGYDTEVMESMIENMLQRYDRCCNSKIGSTINCPYCGKSFIKKTYHKVFCSNQKTHGRKNCKDRYWNTVDEKRRARASKYS